MIKNLYIILFFAISQFAVSQNWASCGQGFTFNIQGIFSDTISDKLYVSGFGNEVDGLPARNIASWDGSKWDTLKHGAIGTSENFLIRYKNKLYLQNNYWIWAWNFATQTWDSIPNSYIGGNIRTACIDQNNDLIIAGEFNSIGNQTIYNIARFDGTNFYPIGNPLFPYYIRTVAIYNNEIYIGGNFATDTVRSGIAKWDGSQWVGVDNGFRGGGPEVCTLKTYKGRLYAGGTWYGTKDKYMPSIAAWDGTKWNAIGDGIYYTWHPWGIVSHFLENKGTLYVLGNFDRAGDINAQNIAMWNDTNWCSMNASFISPINLGAFFRDTLYLANQYVIDTDSTRMLGYYIGSNYMGVCGAAVSINEISISDNIKIHPNPATSVLHIYDEQNDLRNTSIQITNALGELVLSIDYSPQIDISKLPQGIYFLTLRVNSSQKTIKFLKTE